MEQTNIGELKIRAYDLSAQAGYFQDQINQISEALKQVNQQIVKLMQEEQSTQKTQEAKVVSMQSFPNDGVEREQQSKDIVPLVIPEEQR